MTDHNDFEGADVWHGKPFFFIMIGLFCAAICGFIVFGWQHMSAIYQIVTPLGALVFGWAFVRSMMNALHGHNVMLAIGPRGIFDWRIAPAWMPWADILKVEAIQKSGKAISGFRVTMTDTFRRDFPERRMSQLLRWSNIISAVRGYTVAFGALNGSADDIMRALDKYYPHWRNAKAIS